jgi:hypothetical protein
MRYRPLDPVGDYTINVPFLQDSPACVAQAVLTRLLLYQGEWFLDITDGTPWFQNILGKQISDPDIYVKQRILGTPNVTSIVDFVSTFDTPNRNYTMTSTIATAFGQGTVTVGV